MTYTETQLKAIRLLWKKDLSFWCLIFRKEKQIIHQMDSHDMPCDEWEIWRERGNAEPYLLTKDFEILWHECHIEDLFRVAEKKGWLVEIKWWLLSIHFKDRTYTSCKFEWSIPLLDQPNLSDIINLFK